jgi:hypothetical protein
LKQHGYPNNACACLIPLIDLQRITYHYETGTERKFNFEIRIQPGKTFKLINNDRLYNNTVLFKIDELQPTEDKMFLDYGIFPNRTYKPYDDYYTVRMKIKYNQISPDRIDTCKTYGCSGIDVELFAQGLDVLQEMKMSEEYNADLGKLCKLVYIDENELIKYKHGHQLKENKKMAHNIEIKGYACYLDKVNEHEDDSFSYVFVINI